MSNRTKAPDPVEIDPAGEDTVVTYVGPAVVAGIPARDLHGNDLARALYVRAHRATDWDKRDADGNGPALPKPATQAQLAALVDELVESGAYSRDVPRGTDETTQTTTDEPAAPAEG